MNEIPKKRFARGRRVLMGMARRPATVQSVAEVPSQMGEFEHEVCADAESQARRVLGCDLYAIPALDADLRSITGPIINIHNSNVANLNFGAQVGPLNAPVIEQTQKEVADAQPLRITTWGVTEVTLEANYYNAPSQAVTMSCRSVSEREPINVPSTSADGSMMLSQVTPRCLLLNGINHKTIDDLGWKPNRISFEVLHTGELKEYGVEPRDTLEPEAQFAVLWPAG